MPNEAVVHFEEYSDFSEDDINKIYKKLEFSDLTQDLIEENGTETLAQVFTEKRYTKANNIHFSKTLLEVVKKCPIEKMLIETDAPYLAPQAYRGKRNEPWMVEEIAKKTAEIRGVSVEEIIKKTIKNTKSLFTKLIYD